MAELPSSRPPKRAVPLKMVLATKNPDRFRYFAFGLNVCSEIELPELRRSAVKRRPQVWIREGRVKESPSGPKPSADHIHLSSRETVFYWKGESKVQVSNGRRITVDALPAADKKAVRLSILGPAFSQLLFQRGMLVLHASAVVTQGAAVAFIGAAGAGKSTLAAAFYRRGHKLLTDNLLVLYFQRGKVFALPAFPQFKLWPRSARQLGWDPKTLPWIDAVTKKRALGLNGRFAARAVPVQCLYLLGRGPRIRIGEVASAEKLFYFINHSFGSHTYGRNEELSPHFSRCARLVRSLPVRSLQRTGRIEALPELVRAVEEDLSRPKRRL